jgi:hypothetical protein
LPVEFLRLETKGNNRSVKAALPLYRDKKK